MEQKYMNSKNTNNEIVIKKSRFLTHIKLKKNIKLPTIIAVLILSVKVR